MRPSEGIGWAEVRSPTTARWSGGAQGDAVTIERAARAAHAAFGAGGFPQHERAAVLQRGEGRFVTLQGSA